MAKTKNLSLETAMRIRDEWELMDRGKSLLTVEQWEKFALCNNCLREKCVSCVSRPSGLTYDEQLERFYFSLTDDPKEGDPVDKYIPRKLWDIEIQCCSCGSRQHITDWLREALWPDGYDWPELHETLLRAVREEQERSLH
jgi:hypothetical protein